MKTFLLSLFLMGVFVTGASAQSTVEIKGRVKFFENDFKVTAYQQNASEKIVLAETVVNPDHTYRLSVPVSKPGVITIDCGRWQNVDVWLEDENMDIDFRGMDTARIKIKNPPYVYIKAGPKNEVMNLINHEVYRGYQNMIAISQIVYRASLDEAKGQEMAGNLYDMNQKDFLERVKYIATRYADRNSMIAAIQYLDYERDSELIESALRILEQNSPQTGADLAQAYRKQKKEEKEKSDRVKEGRQAPSFSLPDAEGKMHSLEEFKGRVLVVDFWASWCGPCRKEIPLLKEHYEAFKDNAEVAFLSISIDAKRADWEKALAAENMPWLQLLAPNAGKEIMDTYQFGGIPFIIVIDKEGKIHKKHLRGKAVREAIETALAGKKPEVQQGSRSVSMGSMM